MQTLKSEKKRWDSLFLTKDSTFHLLNRAILFTITVVQEQLIQMINYIFHYIL